MLKDFLKLLKNFTPLFGLLAVCSLLVLGAQTGTQHGVNVTWNAPSPVGGSGSINGYNIYRCVGTAAQCTLASGMWVKIDAALDVSTGYLDQSTLVSGQSYSYYSTTVDSNNNESAASNIATVVFTTITNPNPPGGCNAKPQ